MENDEVRCGQYHRQFITAGEHNPNDGRCFSSLHHVPQAYWPELFPWSQSVLVYICGRGKEDHLTGSATRPDSGNVNFKNWKAENNLVMSWLINSMTPEIGENFLLYSIKDIWDVARETYSC